MHPFLEFLLDAFLFRDFPQDLFDCGSDAFLALACAEREKLSVLCQQLIAANPVETHQVRLVHSVARFTAHTTRRQDLTRHAHARSNRCEKGSFILLTPPQRILAAFQRLLEFNPGDRSARAVFRKTFLSELRSFLRRK